MASHDEIKESTIKTYILNLKRRNDRRESFIENNDTQLQQYNYNFFEAVDGVSLIPTPKILKLFEVNMYNYRTGVVGCGYSFVKMFTELKNSKTISQLLIFEDDTHILPNFSNKLEKAISQLPQDDWDVLFLGNSLWTQYQTPNDYDDMLPNISKWNKDKCMTQTMGGMFGFLISKRGATKLLNILSDIGMTSPIDTMIMLSADNLDVYYCYPHLVKSECAFSYNPSNNRFIENNKDSDIQFNFSSLCPNMSSRLQLEVNYWLKTLNIENAVITHDVTQISYIYNNIRLILLKQFIKEDILNNTITILEINELNLLNTILENIKNLNISYYTLKNNYIVLVSNIIITSNILENVAFNNKYL